MLDWFKISLLGGFLFIFTVSLSHADVVAEPATRDALIMKNTTPVGQVEVAGASAAPMAAAVMSGPDRYKASCSVCHDTGAAGAPKLGVKPMWAARVTKGEATLVDHALNGFGAMPPKGMCPTCSDDEIKAAVEYMLNQVK